MTSESAFQASQAKITLDHIQRQREAGAVVTISDAIQVAQVQALLAVAAAVSEAAEKFTKSGRLDTH